MNNVNRGVVAGCSGGMLGGIFGAVVGIVLGFVLVQGYYAERSKQLRAEAIKHPDSMGRSVGEMHASGVGLFSLVAGLAGAGVGGILGGIAGSTIAAVLAARAVARISQVSEAGQNPFGEKSSPD